MKREEFSILEYKTGKLPLVYQTEASECGLACLAMISEYYGYETDLLALRQRFDINLNGLTLSNLNEISHSLGLNSRALALEVEEMSELQLPAILHWEFNHFIVLKKITKKLFVIHDPASGERVLTRKEFGEGFTGVALELTPGIEFTPKKEKTDVSISRLIGSVVGLKSATLRVLAISLVIELLVLLSPFFSQWIIDTAIPGRDTNLVFVLTVTFGLILLLQEVIKAARSWFVLQLNLSIGYQWSINIFKHLMSLPIAYFEKRHVGDVISRFGASHNIQAAVSSILITSILDGLLGIVVLVAMFLYSPALTLLTLVLVGLYLLIRIVWLSALKNATEKTIVISAKLDSYLIESIRGARSIKLFALSSKRASSFANVKAAQINADAHLKKLGIGYELCNGVIFGLHGVIIISAGANYAINQVLTIGMLMAFTAYSSQFTSRAIGLIESLISLKMLVVQSDRLADIVLTEPEDKNSNIRINHDLKDSSVEFRNVSFRYGDTSPYIFKNLSFKIESGESVAIVGPSGCGKTTIFKIMLGILQPGNGDVFIGGVNVDLMPISQRRKILAAVMQDDQLLSGSIMDNICLFSEEKDHALMLECASLSGISSQIDAMPMKYHTLIGDMGTTLSGGQKQRVVIARALYARPKIMLLDEATSHLDVAGERLVNESIKSIDVTRVTIAHRPETIAMADRIIDVSKYCKGGL